MYSYPLGVGFQDEKTRHRHPTVGKKENISLEIKYFLKIRKSAQSCQEILNLRLFLV